MTADAGSADPVFFGWQVRNGTFPSLARHRPRSCHGTVVSEPEPLGGVSVPLTPGRDGALLVGPLALGT